MPKITIAIEIPAIKSVKVLEGYIAQYPNTLLVPDPNWEDPKDGSEAPEVQKYTDVEWMKEHTRLLLIRDIKRGLREKAKREAVINDIDDSYVKLINN